MPPIQTKRRKLTRDFRETVQARARRDSSYRRGLLMEAVEAFLSRQLALGKELLRDYIKATQSAS